MLTQIVGLLLKEQRRKDPKFIEQPYEVHILKETVLPALSHHPGALAPSKQCYEVTQGSKRIGLAKGHHAPKANETWGFCEQRSPL